MKPVIALVDADSFYCSAQVLFRPDLRHRPIVTLSNNDGCVVSRNRAAKRLGIKMGQPAFQLQDHVKNHGLVLFSSQYALYADLSARMMRILEDLAPKIEPYSIDESWLDLSGLALNMSLEEYGRHIQQRVRQWLGLGVGVGISVTKTLAKLANRAAKNYPATGGVVDLTNPARQRRLAAIMPVSEVWGIGGRLTKQLNLMGIQTALDLANADPKSIRRHFSVNVERTVLELNGIPCFDLEESPAPKKQIISSKSFGERVTSYPSMREAVCSYTSRAVEKLRQEQQIAKYLSVFISTSPFSQDRYYSNHAGLELPVPTDDTREFLQAAVRLLDSIWRDGYRYSKAGVMLADFYDPGSYQPGLFDQIAERSNGKQLMATLDKINATGLGKVFFASQGFDRNWSMKRRFLSPAYTTRWSDLPVAK